MLVRSFEHSFLEFAVFFSFKAQLALNILNPILQRFLCVLKGLMLLLKTLPFCFSFGHLLSGLPYLSTEFSSSRFSFLEGLQLCIM
jgi:hypothetical protein